MDFVLWVSRVMHVVASVVWIGGLIFMNTVLHPVLNHHQEMLTPSALAIRRRFFPFLWSALWTMLGTGVFMTILSPRFLPPDFSTWWSQLLAAKVVLFILLSFVSWQAAVVTRRIEASISEGEAWGRTLERLLKRAIVLGILSLLCAGGMAVV